jgi:ribosome recycling factor
MRRSDTPPRFPMNDWNPRMKKTIGHLAYQRMGIRPGSVIVGIVETFRVSFLGNSVPIDKMAAVTRHGERIVVAPYDPALVPTVVKSLTDSKLGAYVLSPRAIAVTVHPANGEQGEETVRHVKKLGEEAKVAVRSIRRDSRRQIASYGRGSERTVQKATDVVVAEIERLVIAKVAEVAG